MEWLICCGTSGWNLSEFLRSPVIDRSRVHHQSIYYVPLSLGIVQHLNSQKGSSGVFCLFIFYWDFQTPFEAHISQLWKKYFSHYSNIRKDVINLKQYAQLHAQYLQLLNRHLSPTNCVEGTNHSLSLVRDISFIILLRI